MVRALAIKILYFYLVSTFFFSLNAMTSEEEEIIDLASRAILLSVQVNYPIEKIQDFLNEGGLPDKVKDEEGNTALMLEVKKNKPDIEIIKLLVNAGADPKNPNKQDETPLEKELKKGINANPEILKLFIDEHYIHRILAVALLDPLKSADPLMPLVKPENINEEDKLGNTLLFIVMPSTTKQLDKSFDLAGRLLKMGANPNIANKDGQTPLHRLFSLIPVIETSQEAEVLRQLIQLLLDYGAIPTMRPQLWRWKREQGKKPYKQVYEGNVKSPQEFLESLNKALQQSTIERVPGQLALQREVIKEDRALIMPYVISGSLTKLVESLDTLQKVLKR